MHNTATIKVHWALGIIGLDATNIVHLALRQLVYKVLNGLLDLEAGSCWALLITFTNRDARLGEE